MNRQQRRNTERKVVKAQTKLYTHQEVQQALRGIENHYKEKIKQIQTEYDITYSMCLATSLNAEPTNFGPTRVCRIVNLFFEQVDAVRSGALDYPTIRDAANKLGIHTEFNKESGMFEVVIDPKNTKGEWK